jgi:hypothetical protein
MKTSNRSITIIGVVLFIVVLASISAYYYVQPHQSTTSQTLTSSSSSTSTASGATTSSNSTHSGSVASSGTVSVTPNAPPAACSSLRGTNSSQGLVLSVYLPSASKQGNDLCIYALLQNGNQASIASLSGNVTVVDSSGRAVYENTLVPFEAGSQAIKSGGTLDFTFLWNTSAPYQGAVPTPGTYSVDVIVQYVSGGSLTPISIEAKSPLTLAS